MIETVCTISQHKHNEQPLNVLTTQAAAPGEKVSQASKKSKQKRRNYSLKQNGSKKHSKSSRYEEFTVQLLYCWIFFWDASKSKASGHVPELLHC